MIKRLTTSLTIDKDLKRLSKIKLSKSSAAASQAFIPEMGYPESWIKISHASLSYLSRVVFARCSWRARWDLNPGSLAPQASVLIQPRLRALLEGLYPSVICVS
jgi:hypothetical protein